MTLQPRELVQPIIGVTAPWAALAYVAFEDCILCMFPVDMYKRKKISFFWPKGTVVMLAVLPRYRAYQTIMLMTLVSFLLTGTIGQIRSSISESSKPSFSSYALFAEYLRLRCSLVNMFFFLDGWGMVGGGLFADGWAKGQGWPLFRTPLVGTLFSNFAPARSVTALSFVLSFQNRHWKINTRVFWITSPIVLFKLGLF